LAADWPGQPLLILHNNKNPGNAASIQVLTAPNKKGRLVAALVKSGL
jgi:hypothetical protein